MSTLLNQMETKRQQAWAQAKEILSHAKNEGRDLTGEEEAAYQRASADLDALDLRVKELQEQDQRQRDSEAAMARLGIQPRATLVDAELDATIRHRALSRSMEPISVAPQQRRSGWQPGLERRELSSSGYVPTSFFNQVVAHMTENSAVLAAGATLVQTETGETYKVPKSTARSTASIITEGDTIPDSDPSLGTASFTAYKYGFGLYCTQELLQDSTFDLTGYLAEQAGLAIGNAAGAHFVTGDGSSKPTGIVTGATVGVTGATSVAGAFDADDVFDLYHSVASPYARSSAAAWMCNNSTLAAIRKLQDGASNYAFDVTIPPGSGASGTLLGRPVFVDPNVASVGLSAKSLIFGDFSKYWVRQAGDFRFEASEHYSFNTDRVTFRALVRLDGGLVDTTGAIKVFQGGAS